MILLWPHLLWLLLVLPLLPALYLWLLRRRAKSSLRYSNVGLARAAAGRDWRRHVPPVLFLLAIAALLVAATRPVARVALPWSRSTVLLAIDVSLSMRVGDVEPSRMVAAQEAAKTFLQEVPKTVEVGLVTFAGSSQVAQRPTLDREALVTAVDAIQMQVGTAIGNAIVICLAELFPEQHIAIDEMPSGRSRKARSLDDAGKPPPVQAKPVAPGSYASAAIILLSDGRRTTGIDTLDAAKMAADRGVRIHVIGLGSTNPAAQEFLPIYMQLDETTLREVARMTGGEYHHAGTAETLRTVYQQLGSRVQVVTRETELTGLFALASALLLVLAAGLSLVWHRRLA